MNARLHFLTAKIKLLHMAGYAHTMVRTMSYGLLKAIEDEDFFKTPIKDLLPQASDEQLEEIVKIKRNIDLDAALNGAKAAALIFVHTGLEGCLEVIAKFDAQQNPNEWLHLFENQKVTIRDVVDHARSELLGNCVEKYLEKFGREPLPEKLKILLSILKPDSGRYKDYVYDQGNLIRIDKLRHECAHGKVDIAEFSSIYEDIDYLKNTGEFFLNLMASKHKLSLD